MKYPSATDQLPLRVMLVDHDIQVLALLTTLLEHYGHDVRTAESAKEALAVAEGFRPEVLYTGIALLVSSGFDLVKQLRMRPACAGTVIVALTGHEAKLSPGQWQAAGFDRVLRKPADIEEIVEVLKDVSAARKAAMHPVR